MNRRSWALDLGCGRRQSAKTAGYLVCGLDISFEALAEPMRRDRSWLVCGRGEQMPFRENSFGLAVSDVAVPYMDIPTVLGEIARVLRPGGTVWLSLHAPSMTAQELACAVRRANLKNTIYRLYILANGAWFMLTGRLFRFPLRRARCESFQTAAAMRRALRAHGFSDFRWMREGQQVVVTAQKPGEPESI